MNALFIYLLKSAGALTAIYTVYYLFLRKDTFFTINRFYLLGTFIFSALIPLIPLQNSVNDAVSSIIIALGPVSVSPKEIPASSSAGLNLIEILTVIYLTGAAIFLIRILVQVFNIMNLIRRSDIKMLTVLRMVNTEKGFSPFSFFNYVFVNRRMINEDDLKGIIAHEYVHARQRHSLDLLLSEAACVVQWFNPVVWMAQKDLRNIHEYLADEGAIRSGVPREGYRELIFNEALGGRINSLTNNFNVSPLKNRILMMTKPRSSDLAKGKIAISLPVIFTVMLLFAGNTTGINSYGQNNQTPVYNQYEAQAGTVLLTPPRHQAPPQDNQTRTSDKQNQKLDKQPEYPGGYEALFTFIRENVKYPEEAKTKNTVGKVLVNFIVKADGSVDQVKVTRRIGSGCDQEAVRVVKLMPKWKPGEYQGKPVDVGMVVPIKFALDGDKEKK